MADTKKADSKAGTSTPKAADLAPASESGDPAVQALLADLQTALLNGTKADQDAARKRLTDLGYSA